MCEIAIINKVIPMSVVDGPGNRTSIFFQGCNFNCIYCHNPETINVCVNCGVCVDKCPENALTIINGKVIWDKTKCVDCDTCIKVCLFDSSPKIMEYTVEDLIVEIKQNIPFIRGITVSGGECTLQWRFLQELFTETKKLGLTNLVDTNGYILLNNPEMEDFLKVTDGFMLDIKSGNIQDHQKLTGRSIETVFRNAKYLAELGKLTEVRTVLIDGFNNRETVEKVVDLIKDYDLINYKMITYRHFGVREDYLDLKPVTKDEKEMLMNYAISKGVNPIDI